MHVARLKGLARAHLDTATIEGEIVSLPDGAVTVLDGHMMASVGADLGTLYLRVALDRPKRLTVFADDPGVVARHCAGLALSTDVRGPDGEASLAVPLPDIVGGLSDVALVGLLRDTGLDVSVEHGRAIGTLHGLVVARLAPDGSLEVGVGEVDMAAATMMNGTDAAALARVVEQVRLHRVSGRRHPIGRLSSARWLRSALREDPAQIAPGEWRDVEPIKPSKGVRDETPACALIDANRLVVCTAVLDRTLIPEVLDQCSRFDVHFVSIAVPTNDVLLATRLTNDLFAVESSVVEVTPPWV